MSAAAAGKSERLNAVIETALPLAQRFEGWRARPYLCPAGVATIGWGHTGRDVTLKTPAWTRPHSDAVLAADMGVYARAVLALSPNLAVLPEREGEAIGAALADFCFNLGVTRYKASTLRRRVAAEDWAGVARELGKWVFGGGRRLPGLVKRRAAEAAMIALGLAN